MIGSVEEHEWTIIAAEDGADIGQRQRTRKATFAFLQEAGEWIEQQEREGFTSERGAVPLATILYAGPTDSPSNAWSVEVARELPRAEG